MEGKPNQLYAQGMRSFEQYDEARKYFAEGRLANEVQAQLELYDVSLGEYKLFHGFSAIFNQGTTNQLTE